VRFCLAAVLLVTGCTGDPAPTDRFEVEVAPILVHRCGSARCHGVAPDAEARGEVVDWGAFVFRLDDRGQPADMDALYAAARRAINTDERPEFSTLLRKALPPAFGGLPHFGGAAFSSPADPGYQTILAWIAAEEGGGELEPPLTELEAHFEREVQPVLVAGSCATASCHGAASAVPYHVQSGDNGLFARAWTRANYREAVRMLALSGEPLNARLIRKGLPLHAGGIVHKGGNNTFFTGPEDPRVAAITGWACAERLARTGVACSDDSGPAAMVFVRGPLSPHTVFDLDVFEPGTAILRAALSGEAPVTEVEDLTTSLSPEPADARDPAISADGARMAFSLRESADHGHAIRLMDLATLATTPLTEHHARAADGTLWTDRDPTFGPGGHVWFVSTRLGKAADRRGLVDAELYEVDPDTGDVQRWTYTPHIERKPGFLRVGKVAGEVAFTALRDLFDDQAHAHPFRFPTDLHVEYHQHFGTTPTSDLFHDLRELPDGRNLMTVGDLTAVWGAGALGVIDRNFGPQINSASQSDDPATPAYADPVTLLSDEGVLARDAAALPDGRVLVATAPGGHAADDPTAAVDFRIELLTLAESVSGAGPSVVSRVVLVDEPGLSDRDPEPIVLRSPLAPDTKRKWDPELSHGLLVHQGLPLIDALLANLSPSGVKAPRTDMAWVRLIEAVDAKVDQRKTTGLTDCSPQRILAELPLFDDGSFQVRIPAGIPFRIQALDEQRRAIGVHHNRWFYVMGGQTLPQGVRGAPETTYRDQCALCHGSLSGAEAQTLGPPDAISMASVTLARYSGADPRLPITPPTAGDETRVALDFVTDIQPVLDRACATAGCHGDGGIAPVLTGAATEHFTEAYEALIGGGWVGQTALSSPLMGLLDGTHAAPLDDAETLAIVRWLDLGGGYALP